MKCHHIKISLYYNGIIFFLETDDLSKPKILPFSKISVSGEFKYLGSEPSRLLPPKPITLFPVVNRHNYPIAKSIIETFTPLRGTINPADSRISTLTFSMSRKYLSNESQLSGANQAQNY